MKTSIYSRLLALTLGLTIAGGVVIGSAGCSSVMVTQDTEGEFRLGELQVFVDHDFDDAYAASKAGLKDFGLFKTGDEKQVVEAELNARDGADTAVTIKIKQVAKNRTSIKIRYGVTGDLAQSQKLFRDIKSHL
jgi:hypothetical protein